MDLAGAEQEVTLPCMRGVVSQQEVDPGIFVEDTAGGPEGGQCPPSKKKKETARFEILDAEQVA